MKYLPLRGQPGKLYEVGTLIEQPCKLYEIHILTGMSL